MKIRKNSLLIILIFFPFIKTYTQTIIGKVTGSKHEPINYYNVVLLNTSDSTIIKGNSFSDSVFSVSLARYSCSDAILRISHIGYLNYYQYIKIDKKDTIVLPSIYLIPSVMSLNEIVIKGEAPLISNTNGVISINVGSTILKNEESIQELLKNAPGIFITNDNTINTFDMKKPLILVNGRKVISPNQIDIIKPGDIKNIEISYNSNAKYDASEKTIINVITKRNYDLWGLQFYHRLDYNTFWNNKTIISINQNYKKISQFVSLTKTFNDYTSIENSNNSIYLINSNIRYSNYFKSNSFEKLNINDLFYAFEFNVNDKNNIGLQWSYNNCKSNQNYFLVSNNSSANVFNEIKNLMYYKNSTINNSFNFNYSFKPDSINEFIFLTDYTVYNKNTQMKNNEENILEKTQLSNKSNIDYLVYSAQSDYSTKLFNKMWSLTAGLKWSKIDNSNINEFTIIAKNNKYVDSLLSNVSILIENNFAGYTAINRKFRNLILNSGIRYETNVYELQNEQTNKRSFYGDFFPSISVDYAINDLYNMSLNFSKSITRVNYQSVSQDLVYINPFLLKKGNKGLKPAIENKISYSILISDLIFFDLNFIDEKNDFVLGFFNNDSIIVAQDININRKKITSGAYLKLKKNKLFSNTGINIFKNFFKYEFLNAPKNTNGLGYFISSSNNFQVSKNLDFYFSLQYSFLGNEDFYNYLPTYNIKTGCRFYFFSKSLRLALFYENISKEKYKVKYNYINIEHEYFKYPHIIYFTILYKINSKLWNKYFSSQKDEQNRF